MKKFFLFFLLISSALFAQGWKDTVRTMIPDYYYDAKDVLDIAKDINGIHVLKYYWGALGTANLEYYRINNTGGIERYDFIFSAFRWDGEPDPFFGAKIKCLNVDGEKRVYILYRDNNYIRLKYITNNTSSWITAGEFYIGNADLYNMEMAHNPYTNDLH